MASSSEFKTKNLKNIHYTLLLPVTDKSTKESTNTTNNILLLITIFFSTMLLCCSIFTILALCLGPHAPVVKLNSLSVTNFTVSNTKLAANWVANFTVYNPSLAMISFDHIESVIFYKKNNALAVTSVESFEMDIRGENSVQMKFSTTGYEGDQPIVEYPVLREIEEDKRRGAVRFNIVMSMRTTYKNAAYWVASTTRRFLMNPYCLDLNVGVVAAGNGSLIEGGSTPCEVVMMLSDDRS